MEPRFALGRRQSKRVEPADLGISQRTVENHRAAIMRKSASKSLPALVRLVEWASRSSGGQTAKD